MKAILWLKLKMKLAANTLDRKHSLDGMYTRTVNSMNFQWCSRPSNCAHSFVQMAAPYLVLVREIDHNSKLSRRSQIARATFWMVAQVREPVEF